MQKIDSLRQGIQSIYIEYKYVQTETQNGTKYLSISNPEKNNRKKNIIDLAKANHKEVRQAKDKLQSLIRNSR